MDGDKGNMEQTSTGFLAKLRNGGSIKHANQVTAAVERQCRADGNIFTDGEGETFVYVPPTNRGPVPRSGIGFGETATKALSDG